MQPSHTPNLPSGRGVVLFLVNAAVLAALAVPALDALLDNRYWAGPIPFQGWLLILIPLVALLHSITAKHHSLAWSTFWVWSLVFLGLAPAYQVSSRGFPWDGSFDQATIARAQAMVLVAHAVVLVAYAVAGRHRQPAVRHTTSPGSRPALRRRLQLILLTHVAISLVFMGLMGSAMISGRLVYQGQLAFRDNIPFFGSLYFLATAGSVILPACAVLLRRQRVQVSKSLIGLSTAASFAVTNPLAGSRFLTGAFLLAFIGALMSSQLRRWLPLVATVALVTIFPSTDLFRGNATGATGLEIAAPSQGLLTFDFDAFEMLARSVYLGGNLPAEVPSQAELLIAPFLRWIPVLSRLVEGDASGPAVARSTFMGFTNVSMPLWGEAYLSGSWLGVLLGFTLLGWLLAKTRSTTSVFGLLLDIPVAALLFIVLRGSLYEVLGYVLMASLLAATLAQADRQDQRTPDCSLAGPSQAVASLDLS